MKRTFARILTAAMVVGLLSGVPVAESNAAESYQTMYRLYNPNNSEHFYTADTNERDYLDSIGWNYEGIAWYAPKTSSYPVYRLYNPNSGEHHYTADAAERDSLSAIGWRYEQIGWYSDDNRSEAIYRLYNPYSRDAGAHHYTKSDNERSQLIVSGWRAEGVGWYGLNPNATGNNQSTGNNTSGSSNQTPTTPDTSGTDTNWGDLVPDWGGSSGSGSGSNSGGSSNSSGSTSTDTGSTAAWVEPTFTKNQSYTIRYSQGQDITLPRNQYGYPPEKPYLYVDNAYDKNTHEWITVQVYRPKSAVKWVATDYDTARIKLKPINSNPAYTMILNDGTVRSGGVMKLGTIVSNHEDSYGVLGEMALMLMDASLTGGVSGTSIYINIQGNTLLDEYYYDFLYKQFPEFQGRFYDEDGNVVRNNNSETVIWKTITYDKNTGLRKWD